MPVVLGVELIAGRIIPGFGIQLIYFNAEPYHLFYVRINLSYTHYIITGNCFILYVSVFVFCRRFLMVHRNRYHKIVWIQNT
jgi:hypothetical protein